MTIGRYLFSGMGGQAIQNIWNVSNMFYDANSLDSIIIIE